MNLFSTEQISKYHPDKVCDQISDAILDACLSQDRGSRVACETMFKGNAIILGGEITTRANVEYGSVARRVAKELGYRCDFLFNFISSQSPEIASGVGEGVAQGAGDQGMMYGYACSGTESRLPYGFDLANRIIHVIESDIALKGEQSPLKGDAKTQVTVDREKNDNDLGAVRAILVSVCHKEWMPLPEVRRYIQALLNEHIGTPAEGSENLRIIINPAGSWTIGGPEADCGLTGRKIVCDQYGGFSPVGGGAFSGKDPSKVDRSGAYMARKIACDMLDSHNLDEITVQLAYAIGEPHPVSVRADCVRRHTDNDKLSDMITEIIKSRYDLTPHGIIEQLDLLIPKYEEISRGCHYRKDFWR